MSQNTAESSYGSHNEHGGEHKDRLPQAVSGGSSATATPANAEDGKSGIKVGIQAQDSMPVNIKANLVAQQTTPNEPTGKPDFAYRKPAGHESLGEKVAKVFK